MMESLIALYETDLSILHNIWHYTILNISGNDIKISNIVIALILFATGIKFSKKISKVTSSLILKKIHHDHSMINNLERIIMSIFFGVTMLLSLQIANIPLNIFAFVGGAVAIGFGLGVQGVVNNLINTIIIMVEKPIKVGDIVEIEDTIGVVTLIGARCIHINSFNSGEVLIPNTMLMQHKLSRWSCNDNIAYVIYINVQKTNNSKIDHNFIIQQLKIVIDELGSLVVKLESKIYLTKISDTEDQFCLQFYCNIKSFKEHILIKDKVNFALLKHLDMPFKLEYSKNLG